MKNNQPKLCLFLIALMLGVLPLSVLAEKQLKIAMVLWRGETPAEKSFKKRLDQFGYKVVYETFDAGQDLTQLGKILKRISDSAKDYDYVYTFGTTVSRRARVVINDRIPQVFNVVTDPVGAGIIQETIDARGNITGVSDELCLTELFEVAENLFAFKKLGIFFNPREKNSLLSRNQIYKIADDLGFEVVDFRSPPMQEELQRNLKKLRENPNIVDAVFFPSDSFLVSNAEEIAKHVNMAKMISLGTTRHFVEKGLLFGVGVDYNSLGKIAADIIDRNQKGEQLQDIPFERAEDVSFYLNKTTFDMLGIKLDFQYLQEVVILH